MSEQSTAITTAASDTIANAAATTTIITDDDADDTDNNVDADKDINDDNKNDNDDQDSDDDDDKYDVTLYLCSLWKRNFLHKFTYSKILRLAEFLWCWNALYESICSYNCSYCNMLYAHPRFHIYDNMIAR